MRRSRPRRAAEVLEPVAAASAPRTQLGAIQAVWTDAVGEGIASAARPISFGGGELTVSCESATWAQELDLLSPKLMDALSERLAAEQMPARIKFVCG